MRSIFLSIFFGCALLHGCTDANRGNRFGTVAAGGSCKHLYECYPGFECSSNVCSPLTPIGGTGPKRGDPCTSSNECPAGMNCGSQGRCTTRTSVSEGGVCVLDIDCDTPLLCNGKTSTCTQDDNTPGTYDLDDACDALNDCRRPLMCGLEHTCARLPLFTGSVCNRADNERGSFRAYFEVPDPASTEEATEFYRLPFPSDIRVVNGHISLQGHQSPGDVLGVDIPATYFTPVEEDASGYPVNTAVFFNFSAKVDYRTICGNAGSVYPEIADPEDVDLFCEPSTATATIWLIDVDPNSVNYGDWIPTEINASRSKNQYICQNWMGVAPLPGKPLKEGTTYAMLIKKGIKSALGKDIGADRDFTTLIASTAPSDADRPELTAAYAALAPLRAWASANNVDLSLFAGGTVFTTATNSSMAGSVRIGVAALPTPTFNNDAHVCGSDLSDKSPCDDNFDYGTLEHQRGCFGEASAFHEVQGTYKNPIFQSGTRPYRTTAMGGSFVWSNGVPVKQGEEDLCYALTVPKNTAMPSNGWPVVIYSHGTGGSFREFIGSPGSPLQIVTQLTDAGYVVIGIDNVSHGRRQGIASADAWSNEPGNLFFNIFNPRASRDNVLQGNADLFQLMRLLRNTTHNLNVSLPMGGTTANVTFDPSKIYFLGQSHGAVIAPGFVAFDANLKGVVLSGAGAELPLTILNKTNPTDLNTAVSAFFGDRSLHRIHPMMNILATLFGPAEGVTYAPYMVRDRLGGKPAVSYMQISGVTDTFSPDVAQHALIRSLDIPMVGYTAQTVSGVSATVGNSAQGNLTTTSGNTITGGALQFLPLTGSDGHFVLFDVPAAATALHTFFDTAASQAYPKIQRP